MSENNAKSKAVSLPLELWSKVENEAEDNNGGNRSNYIRSLVEADLRVREGKVDKAIKLSISMPASLFKKVEEARFLPKDIIGNVNSDYKGTFSSYLQYLVGKDIKEDLGE